MRRQQWWRGAWLAVVALVASARCTVADNTADDAPGGTPPTPGSTAAPSPGAGGGQAAGVATLPGVPSAEQARTELAGLTVAAHGSMSGYSRAKFPHWIAQGGSCGTREAVLERDGSGVQRDEECRAVSGKWVSVYDDKTFTDASDLDHTVPLATAWRSGAADWTQDERKKFANDLTHPQLLAVSAATNRSKGDQGPDEWRPPAKTYWCTYARSWILVKAEYELSVTGAEKNMLTDMLDTCTS